MNQMSKLYKQIRLSDGRNGIIVDNMGDVILVDTMNSQNEWETVAVVWDGDEYHICDDGSKAYCLCKRKGVSLYISETNTYCFLFADLFDGDYFPVNEKQYRWMCDLLDVDNNDIQGGWFHFFEYNNFTPFLNAYKFVRQDNGFYYAYGYDEEKKTADALYRFKEGRFERYFSGEAVWREMPEQRMILKDKKPRYTWVSEEIGMSLSLLV